MVDRDALSKRLDALETYLAELEGFREIDRERFVREPALHHLAERYLHLACETVLDTAHHVIADTGLKQASSYREAIDVLAKAGHLEPTLADRLRRWMGFRNVLVHFYLDLDHGRTYDAIANDLGDLREFMVAMAALLVE